MVTPWEEEQLLKDVMDGLGVAIHDTQVDIEKLNSIKLNKLFYLAVDEFDLPITYSWFIYGVSLGYKSDDVDSVESRSLSDLPSPDEPSIGEPWDYPTPEEYAYFFKRDVDLNNIFRENTKEYLGEFYDGYAPEEYKQVYTSCAILQKSIDQVLQADYEEFLSEYQSDEDTLKQEIQDLSTDILLNEHIDDEATDAFSAYSHLVMEVLDYISLDDLSKREFSTFEDILHFFYSHAWRYVALMISEQTVTGPSRRELLKGAVSDLDSLEKTYSEELAALRNKAERDGILPAQQHEVPPIPAELEADAESVSSALDTISENMESENYDSMDVEQYMK